MKILINLSNHNSSKWSESQKAGWDEIIDLQFPNIPPTADTIEMVNDFINPVAEKLGKLAYEIKSKGLQLSIMLQGEFTFSFLLYDILKNSFSDDNWKFYIPCTERKIQEITNPDGTVTKNSIFEFIGWRVI